jgi:aminobenzoyl-glutamate transport protein
MIEPRLGRYEPQPATTAEANAPVAQSEAPDPATEGRGLRFALFGFLGVLAVVVLATAPPGAPLRDPSTGQVIGNTPFMDSLLFIIAMFFLVSGICYGLGAGTFKGSNDVIAAVTRTFNGLGGLIFMLLLISQFIAYFNYTNLPSVAAIGLADLLERAAVPSLVLLIGFIVVILLLDFIIPGAIPKWAIFAPVFLPIFAKLGIGPQTVLAAYRVGDSPVNTLTPLMVYLPFIVTIAQRYVRTSGIGTVVAMMLPYALIMAVVWVILFVLWYLTGLPLGPGYPVRG